MSALKSALSVGETARRSGVAVSTIHFYDAEGLIAGWRTEGNQRRYPRAVLRRIAIIRIAQRAGIPLATVREALAAGDIDQVEYWLAMGELGMWVRPEARLDWVWRLAEARRLRGDVAGALAFAHGAFRLAHSASSFGPGIDGGSVYGTYVAVAPTMAVEFVPQVVDLGVTVDWPQRLAVTQTWCAALVPEADRSTLCEEESVP